MLKRYVSLFAIAFLASFIAPASGMVLQRTITEITAGGSNRFIGWSGIVDDELGRDSIEGWSDNSLVDVFSAGREFTVGHYGTQSVSGFFVDVAAWRSEFGFTVSGYLPSAEEWDAGQRPTISSASVVMEAQFYDSNQVDPSYNPLLEHWRVADNMDVSVELDIHPDFFFSPGTANGDFSRYSLQGYSLTAQASPIGNAIPEPGAAVVWIVLMACGVSLARLKRRG